VAGAGELFEITERFLTGYRQQLAEMPPSDFEAHKRGLISQLLEQDKNLSERSQRFWRDLELGYTSFDSRRQLADLVAGIDHETYLGHYDRLLERMRTERLVVFSTGRFAESAPAGRLIADPERFKRQEAPVGTAAGSPAGSAHNAE
jgi:secreted Zn-dependent insulinase-like peptidase